MMSSGPGYSLATGRLPKKSTELVYVLKGNLLFRCAVDLFHMSF
jgi:hypothetical protein